MTRDSLKLGMEIRLTLNARSVAQYLTMGSRVAAIHSYEEKIMTDVNNYPVTRGLFIIMFFGGLLFLIATVLLVFMPYQFNYDLAINYGSFLGIMLVIPEMTMLYSDWQEKRKNKGEKS